MEKNAWNTLFISSFIASFFYWEIVCFLLFINSSFPQLWSPLAFFPLLKNRTSIWRLPQKHFSEGWRQDSWKVPMSEFTLRKLFCTFVYFLLLLKCRFISEEIFRYQSQHCINIEILLGPFLNTLSHIS